MWDWRNCATSAGYRERAPRFFDINPNNHTGRWLHKWLRGFDEFKVTNACPQLVSSAKGRGKPCKEWVRENLQLLSPFDVLLVCGKVAQETYSRLSAGNARVIEMPHPAARFWSNQGRKLAEEVITTGRESCRILATAGVFRSEPFPS